MASIAQVYFKSIMRYWFRVVLLSGVGVLGLCGAGWAETGVPSPYMTATPVKRHALLIGTAHYTEFEDIPSALNDVEGADKVFRDLGFSINKMKDPKDLEEIEDGIVGFMAQLKKDDVAVVYFSGHGFSYNGVNYYAPANLPKVVAASNLANAAASLQGIEELLVRRNPGLLLILYDACSAPTGIIRAENDATYVPKAVSEPARTSAATNRIIGFATSPGTVALGSRNDVMSVFTDALTSAIGMEGQPIEQAMKDVSATVVQNTNGRQHPGLYDWSNALFYLNPTPDVLESERKVWQTALASGSRDRVVRFTMRYSTSPFIAAARRWLADNPPQSAPPVFTRLSPQAVDRAWRPEGEQRVAVAAIGETYAFPRRIAEVRQTDVAALSDPLLGLVPSGTAPAVVGRTLSAEVGKGMAEATLQVQRLQSLAAHGQVVVLQDMLIARTEPSPAAPVATRLRRGERIAIQQTFTTGGRQWMAVGIPRLAVTAYVRAPQPSAKPAVVELGRSLVETVARPVEAAGGAAVIDDDGIRNALEDLKAQNRHVSWVSLATAPSRNEEEALLRAIQIDATQDALKKYNIDGRIVTAVSGVDDFRDDGVRVRIFGY